MATSPSESTKVKSREKQPKRSTASSQDRYLELLEQISNKEIPYELFTLVDQVKKTKTYLIESLKNKEGGEEAFRSISESICEDACTIFSNVLKTITQQACSEEAAILSKLCKQRTSVFHAATKMAIDEILIKNPDVLGERNGLNPTPFFSLAKRSKNTELVNKLLEHAQKVDKSQLINEQDMWGNTSLIWAVANANVEMALHLSTVSNKFNINLNLKSNSLNHGNTALHLAIAKGWNHRDNKNVLLPPMSVVIRSLLKNGANPNALSNSNNTPLHIAATAGDIKSVKLLIKFKASVISKNSDNLTPLMMLNNFIDYRNAKTFIQHQGAVTTFPDEQTWKKNKAIITDILEKQEQAIATSLSNSRSLLTASASAENKVVAVRNQSGGGGGGGGGADAILVKDTEETKPSRSQPRTSLSGDLEITSHSLNDIIRSRITTLDNTIRRVLEEKNHLIRERKFWAYDENSNIRQKDGNNIPQDGTPTNLFNLENKILYELISLARIQESSEPRQLYDGAFIYKYLGKLCQDTDNLKHHPAINATAFDEGSSVAHQGFLENGTTINFESNKTHLIPYNKDGNHWVLIAVNNDRIAYIDPFGGKLTEKEKTKISHILSATSYDDIDFSRHTFIQNKMKFQYDKINCGPLTCKVAEIIAKDPNIINSAVTLTNALKEDESIRDAVDAIANLYALQPERQDKTFAKNLRVCSINFGKIIREEQNLKMAKIIREEAIQDRSQDELKRIMTDSTESNLSNAAAAKSSTQAAGGGAKATAAKSSTQAAGGALSVDRNNPLLILTRLTIHIKKNQIQALEHILNENPEFDLNKPDAFGKYPLEVAFQYNNHKAVKLLLEHGNNFDLSRVEVKLQEILKLQDGNDRQGCSELLEAHKQSLQQASSLGSGGGGGGGGGGGAPAPANTQNRSHVENLTNRPANSAGRGGR